MRSLKPRKIVEAPSTRVSEPRRKLCPCIEMHELTRVRNPRRLPIQVRWTGRESGALPSQRGRRGAQLTGAVEARQAGLVKE